MHQRDFVVVLIATGLAASIGATSPAPRALPARDAPAATAGEFVWHDLVTENPAACRAFYGALFGWTFEPGAGVEPGYTIIKHGGRPIGGIVPRRQQGNAAVAQWLAYVAVPDVDRTADAFEQAGGRIFRGPLNARKDLRVAVVVDAQGAPLGLASRGPGRDQESPPPLHRWLWMEYVARDPAAALEFYRKAVGFAHEISDTRDDFTYYLLTTDRPRAGLFRSPWPREASVWLPYVRVNDAATTAARAVELGGQILVAPRAHVRNGTLAIVLDPTGAPLALQKFPFDRGLTP